MHRTLGAAAPALIAAVLLAGCAYRGPEPAPGDPVAEVRFASKNTLGRFVFTYDDQSCKVSPRTGALGTTGGVMTLGETSDLHMLDTPARSNQVFERRVSATRPLVFSWLHVVGQASVSGTFAGNDAASCSGTFMVTLVPGRQYETVYDNTAGRCTITFSRLDQVNGAVVRVPEPSFHALDHLCGYVYGHGE